ncbi:hypothetical protein ACW9HR_35285 [Nocardia gipuzkoensis]|uniref:hypothetical protein n=1 Tax=Nocardia TaxID=1817 RepID=UPI001E441963|nr:MULTISPECIES: hypothetical protein [Nocardia]MDE1674411.1 hypothetical protein [Nocardia gipuzkoensis]UGT70155.1 hypothetical protein LTT66_08310 [Nocardia gipuzkoensis]
MMRISQFTATALVALAATAITTSAAHAQPSPDDAPLDLRGSFHQIAYEVAATEDRRAAVATIQDGTFELTHDGRVVTVSDRDGAVVAALPMTLRIGEQRVALRPVLEDAGHRLTVAPVAMADTPLRDIGAQERFYAEAEKAMPSILAGAGIGAAIGFVVGFPLGLFVLDFITVPVAAVAGAAIGAMAGFVVGGGQPAVDAALEYVTAP